MSVRPLLVGEDNPYSLDPNMALYPYPERSAGWRLATEILGLHRATYLEIFERINLCSGKWSARQARLAAQAIARVRAMAPSAVTILCGAKVAAAFGLEPATADHLVRAYRFGPGEHMLQGGYVVLPHPSFRCRLWNDDAVIYQVREGLARLLPGIPFGERERDAAKSVASSAATIARSATRPAPWGEPDGTEPSE